MNTTNQLATRRRVLKGMMGGAAVTVGLPFLDCFLNTNGTALAATGQKLPDIYSTWYWGLGFNPGRWEPPAPGPITQLGPEAQPLERFKNKINLFSGMTVHLDGRPFKTHYSGLIAQLTGVTPRSGAMATPTIDTLIADHISSTVRFKSLEMTAGGDPKTMYSYRAGGVFQPGEASPAAMYTRLFGPEFQDPNAADFKPDPRVMARQSVLSAVRDQRKAVEKIVGASDRARLDEYFTSLRQLEQQVEIMLQKPAPLDACTHSAKIEEGPVGAEVELTAQTHKLHAQLAAHAFACDQTRVVNLAYSNMSSAVYRQGNQMTHHILTHEERADPELGYQPSHEYFATRAMSAFADLLAALNEIREGDKTLLDRALVFGVTDTSFGKTHSLDNLPIITAGSANGHMKTGIYYVGKGDPATRVGLTVQQALGLPVNEWGADSMATSKTITEVLA